MALKCPRCNQEWTFDNEHIGKNGKKIPLDPATHTPHDCPMREKRDEYSFGSRPVEDKDDHGNELVQPLPPSAKEEKIMEYVDHTAKGASKVQIFSNETKADTQAEYNEFLRLNNGKIKTQGAHDHVTKQDETEPLVYSIYLYYEETK